MQGTALVCLPTVNQDLYQSAKFKPPVWVLYILGGVTIISMGFFLIQIIADVFLWTLGGIALGTFVYIAGITSGKKEGFNYEARMEQDFHLLEKD
jgi:hypothetical protein